MNRDHQKELIEYLRQFVTPSRQQLIGRVLAQRTRHVAVMLENIFQPHNASAVLRSCDLFGVQDVHVVENEYEYRVNPDVAMGASKWLTLHRYGRADQNNTQVCIEALKAQGYKIVATSLRPNSIPLSDLSTNQKLLLCFGTEEHGLSDTAHQLADEFVKIPMMGFTQSFNISVSAALCLYEVTRKIKSSGVDWELSEQEKLELTAEWLRKSATNSNALMRHFYREQGLAIPAKYLEVEESNLEE